MTPTDPALAQSRRSMPWCIDRVETRITHAPSERYVARVEAFHAERGRLTGLARAQGPMQATLRALADLAGHEADLTEMSLNSHLAECGRLSFDARVRLACPKGTKTAATAQGADAMEAAAEAMLLALEQLQHGAGPS